MQSRTEVGAYFYPLITNCPSKKQRTQELSRDCNIPLDRLNNPEQLLTQHARPLFNGHNQPNTYCLDEKTIFWDDSDQSAIEKQIALADDHGLSFFIFDEFLVKRRGKITHDMPQAREIFKRIPNNPLKYARMETLRRVRTLLPLPRRDNPSNRYDEPDPFCDLDKETAHLLVDDAISDWENPNYFHIKGRPYWSIMTGLPQDKPLIEEIKEYSNKKYHIDPYLVCIVLRDPNLGRVLVEGGADAMTGYCFLPNYETGSPPLQQFDDSFEKRKKDWSLLNTIFENIPYIPPAVVGWDASPRGEQGYSLEEVKQRYPYTPIIVGSSPENFKKMLKETLIFIRENVPPDEQYGLICAWNEISEGASLLPKMVNGSVDSRYLKAVKEVTLNI